MEFKRKNRQIGKLDDNWNWHQKELQGFIDSAIPKILKARPVWLFVDALDECSKKDAVDLIEWLESLPPKQLATHSQLHVCISSRHYPILGRDFKYSICAEEENEQDISTYVKARFADRIELVESLFLDLITGRASGIFMWARLVVNRVLELYDEGRSFLEIQEIISSIPEELDELYNDLIRDMANNPDSLKLIQWICFAARPLSLNELRWAMVIEPDRPLPSLRDYEAEKHYISDVEKMKKQLLTLSRGLAEITNTQTWSGRGTVQFIHQSVKDFFLNQGLSTLHDDPAPFGSYEMAAHFRLSKSCFYYATAKEIKSAAPEFDRPSDSHLEFEDTITGVFHFLHYAVYHWGTHLREIDSKIIVDHYPELFTRPPTKLMNNWSHACLAVRRVKSSRPGHSFIYAAAIHNIPSLLTAMVREANQDFDLQDDKGRTPLSYAAYYGNAEIIKMLLATCKLDINSRNWDDSTPLHAAVEGGHVEIIELLLATGKADTDAQNYMTGTPLHLAAMSTEEVLKPLLATGKATINARNALGQTALHIAAESTHGLRNVRMLLDTGKVDTNAKDDCGRTPLHRIAQNVYVGREAELLLATGVGIDSKDLFGRTPLSYAAASGLEGLVTLFLGTGNVDINSRDKHGRTALFYAATCGHVGVIRLLLATGKVAIGLQDENGKTALSLAVEREYKSTAELLRSHG